MISYLFCPDQSTDLLKPLSLIQPSNPDLSTDLLKPLSLIQPSSPDMSTDLLKPLFLSQPNFDSPIKPIINNLKCFIDFLSPAERYISHDTLNLSQQSIVITRHLLESPNTLSGATLILTSVDIF